MRFTESSLHGVWIIDPQVYEDSRGFFMETWSKREFETHGIVCDFVQHNHSASLAKGTLRGIHFQKGEHAQAKLVRCVRGAVLDVAVDLRPSSVTYGKWEAVELSGDNRRMVFIPKGFGHGFVTLAEGTEFLYSEDAYYMPEAEGGIVWNDPDLGIDWGIVDPVLSERDRRLPLFRDAETGFEDL